ncbi:hypothetical protein HAX54_003673, partial [Datura stramonium]|nr:hypothetical protein [Datura stramonium]
MSRATFSPVTPNMKKFFADDYKTWWSKTHGNFLDGYLETLVDAVGQISTKLSESNGGRALSRERSQQSGESVSGPNPIKLISIGKIKKEATSIPRDRVRVRLSFDFQKHPTAAVSVFDGKK